MYSLALKVYYSGRVLVLDHSSMICLILCSDTPLPQLRAASRHDVNPPSPSSGGLVRGSSPFPARSYTAPLTHQGATATRISRSSFKSQRATKAITASGLSGSPADVKLGMPGNEDRLTVRMLSVPSVVCHAANGEMFLVDLECVSMCLCVCMSMCLCV